MVHFGGERSFSKGVCEMQERWIADRAMLQRLIQRHPEWTRAANWRTGLVDPKAGSRNGSNVCVRLLQEMPLFCSASHLGAKRRIRRPIRRGTSILLDAQVQADFHAQTVLEGVIHFLQQYGVPPTITFDRDPRFVGAATGRD